MKGRFLTLEGVDGAGKSTHVQTIRDLVAARAPHVIVTREPGGSELAEKLRALVLAEPMAPLAETLLLIAARSDHVARVIRPALEAGHWVVCDRFIDSTAAYQGAGKGVPQELIASLSAAAHPGLAPDRTLLFDCEFEVAAKRLMKTDKTLDRFEREERAFFERVRAGYLERARAEPARIRVIDASLPVNDIRRVLERELKDF